MWSSGWSRQRSVAEARARRRMTALLILAFLAWLVVLFSASLGMTVVLGLVDQRLHPPSHGSCMASSSYQPVLFGPLHPCGSTHEG